MCNYPPVSGKLKSRIGTRDLRRSYAFLVASTYAVEHSGLMAYSRSSMIGVNADEDIAIDCCIFRMKVFEFAFATAIILIGHSRRWSMEPVASTSWGPMPSMYTYNTLAWRSFTGSMPFTLNFIFFMYKILAGEGKRIYRSRMVFSYVCIYCRPTWWVFLVDDNCLPGCEKTKLNNHTAK